MSEKNEIVSVLMNHEEQSSSEDNEPQLQSLPKKRKGKNKQYINFKYCETLDYALSVLKADTVNQKYYRKYKSTFTNPPMHLYRCQTERPVVLRIVFSQTDQSVTIQISDDEHIYINVPFK